MWLGLGRVRVSNRVSVRVIDRFGFEFSGFSISIIRNYFLRATLQLCVNSRGPLKFTCPICSSTVFVCCRCCYLQKNCLLLSFCFETEVNCTAIATRHIALLQQLNNISKPAMLSLETASLHCALSLAARCIVIDPVCGFVCVCLCVGKSVTTITRNCVHRSSPNWVCRWR